jgi:hypothetical protein
VEGWTLEAEKRIWGGERDKEGRREKRDNGRQDTHYLLII